MSNNYNGSWVEDSSSDEDDEWETFLTLQLLSTKEKSPYHTSALTGVEYVEEILAGPVAKCERIFSMNQACFRSLCDFLGSGNYLQESARKRMPIEESVAIFLYIVGHSHRHRVAADRFQHSTETINRHFKEMLRGIARAAPILISPPDVNITHSKITNDPHYFPWFQGAIGAIDGTLVDAWAPTNRHNACRGRKGNISQNVMAACDFDMMFTFVYPGWEGSANDSRVILNALQNGLLHIPPNNKYYLVDCGYTNMPGFLAPYRCERYHLQDFEGDENDLTGARELFNKRHSRLRNVIEMTFGVFKKRFLIFKYMTNYKPPRQVLMVNAYCALHNFIRMHSANDSYFAEFSNDDFIPPAVNEANPAPDLDVSQAQINRMARKRDRIAEAMWNAHGG